MGIRFKKFYEKIFESFFDKNLTKRNKDTIFINSIIDYFNLKTNINSINDANTKKRDPKSTKNIIDFGNITNAFYCTPITSHYKLNKDK